MTKKDYVLLAAALKASRCEFESGSEYGRGVRTQFEVTALKLATALQSDNQRFDRERFLKACGVNDND